MVAKIEIRMKNTMNEKENKHRLWMYLIYNDRDLNGTIINIIIIVSTTMIDEMKKEHRPRNKTQQIKEKAKHRSWTDPIYNDRTLNGRTVEVIIISMMKLMKNSFLQSSRDRR